MARKYLRVERGERIDQPDFAHTANVSQRQYGDQIVYDALMGGQPRVIRGFVTFATTTNVTVTRSSLGIAALNYREGGTIKFGALVSDGDTDKSLEIGAYPDATYKVYIAAEFQDTDYGNRVFWNPLAPSPVESVRSIPTRLSENWALAIELSSPGPEWLEIASIVKVGSTLTITDTRKLVFEGALANTYALVDADWGAASTDRNSDRAVNGVRSFRQAIVALMRQVQDIIGGGTLQWWKLPSSGTANGSDGPRNLTALNDEKLARNGAQLMTGNLLPNGSGVLNLGSGGSRWNLIANSIDGFTGMLNTLVASVSVDSPYFKATGSSASPVANGVYKENSIKACGTLSTNGAGAVTSTWGHNIASLSVTTDHIEVNLTTPMSSTNYGVVLGKQKTTGGAGTTYEYQIVTSSQFWIFGYNAAGTIIDPSITALILTFQAIGAQ